MEVRETCLWSCPKVQDFRVKGTQQIKLIATREIPLKTHILIMNSWYGVNIDPFIKESHCLVIMCHTSFIIDQLSKFKNFPDTRLVV